MKTKRNLIVRMMLSVFFTAGLAALSSTGILAQEKGEKPNPKLAKQAKISMAKAREIARAKASGNIESEELEKEHGKLVYSFDIRNEKGTITEVQVDAKTGGIVSVEEEDKEAEAKEKQEDSKKKKKN
jgi:hypothetical protein